MPKDDLGPISFKWHFERGILKPRMSGYELAGFIIDHMASVLSLGLLAGHERIQREFEAMLVVLATSKREAIDKLLPWIRTIYQEEEDDIIHMSLFDKTPIPEGKRYYI